MTVCDTNDFNIVKKYRSCTFLEHFHMNFNGLNGHQKNSDKHGCIDFCCLSLAPGITLSDDPEVSIKRMVDLRNKIIDESKTLAIAKDNESDELCINTKACSRCPYFHEMESDKDGRVHFVNINMYPAPCQGKCIYCGVHDSNACDLDVNKDKEIYENAFRAIEWAVKNDLIAEDALWQVASGEVTIHPYKKRMLELMKDKTSKFLTNCFIYDDQIAEILKSNPHSCINLSIDAGTAETWHKVKGVNNFRNVLENLSKYSNSCISPEQITLKYIILPGINDNKNDYQGVIDIMKKLKIKSLIISRDNRFRIEKMILSQSIVRKKKNAVEQYSSVDHATGYLAAMLIKNGLKAEDGTFWPDEYERANRLAAELLQAGEI